MREKTGRGKAGIRNPQHRSRTIERLEQARMQVFVGYGTSLTASGGWMDIFGAELRKRYDDRVTVINAAEVGMWSEWGVENLEERVLSASPDMVFIEFAINDAYLPYRTSVALCRRNLGIITKRILDTNPDCEIVLMTMNPPTGVHLEARPRIAEYVQVYRDVAAAQGFFLVDQYPLWRRLMQDDKAEFERCVPDGLHPVEYGSRKITVPAILEVLQPANNGESRP